MQFILGCNYWASHAGTEMWRNWNEDVVRSDLKKLCEYNVKYLRIFPLWRDFQPIVPCMRNRGRFEEYRFEGDILPQNKYYLDETMLSKFEKVCDICDEFGLKVIVGLITGFMSGRLFVPPAIYGKNIFSDEISLLFQQRFVSGFVERFKDRDTVWAWDLGNECNGMWPDENMFVSSNWTGLISNAIRAKDNTRQIISGMHGLNIDPLAGAWSIEGQAEFVDVMTTHPYSYWVKHADKDRFTSYRTLMHATFETKLYSDLSGKECLVEELGTVGPMVCNEENAGDFLRMTCISNYANGAMGVLWWCANEQTNLRTIPHQWYQTEVELGMLYADKTPKPVLFEMKKIHEFLESLDFELPKIKEDLVCVLTKEQDQWGVAYMSFCLAKQNDLTMKFCFGEKEIPIADTYLMPSISGDRVINHVKFDFLRDRVYNHGATLYISNNDGVLAGFNELTGLRVFDSGREVQSGTINMGGEEITYKRTKTFFVEENGAEVLAYDDKGMPAITKYAYGKGTVIYVNFPLEQMLLDENCAFDENRNLVYKNLFKDIIERKLVTSQNKYVTVTEHIDGDDAYCVAINHTAKEQKAEFSFNGCRADKIYHGNLDVIPPFESVIFKISK